VAESIYEMLELNEAQVLGAARAMPIEAAQNLLCALDSMLTEIERTGRVVVEAKELPSLLGRVKNEYRDDIGALMSRVHEGSIGPNEFVGRAREVIGDGFRQAYQLGVNRDLDSGDEEWLRRAVDSEVGYASDFANQVKNGDLARFDQRVQHYANALDGIAWNAKVEELPDETVIHWRLGQAEHCDDCILMSMHSPYTKYSLPTTPRAGDTVCRMNCRCRLEFVYNPQPGETMPETGVAEVPAWEEEPSQPFRGDLEQLLAPTPAPAGFILPDAIQRTHLDELYAEMNYQRRLVAVLDEGSDEFAAAVQARKQANAEIIDYLEENGLWDAPLVSVDEVVTEKHMSLLAERQLFATYGVSGDALTEVETKQIGVMLERYRQQVGDKFKKFGE